MEKYHTSRSAIQDHQVIVVMTDRQQSAEQRLRDVREVRCRNILAVLYRYSRAWPSVSQSPPYTWLGMASLKRPRKSRYKLVRISYMQ